MARAGTLTGVTPPAVCSGCGSRIVGRANFCPQCGRALQRDGTRGAGDAGERKVVSVLFADLCDSLTLIERRDPEEAHALLEDVVQVMRAEAHRFGGTVTEILGDGIVVLFGAPVALEAHADRATCAGLAMVDALRSYAAARGAGEGELALRVGIATGEVVLDTRHADTGTSYAATGETPHLAARLQKLARRNGVCVCDQTRRLLTEPLLVESAPGARVDGLSRTITLHHIAGRRLADQPGPVTGLVGSLRALVGRERELARLEAALAEAAGLAARFVRITGEAGVGKSSLTAELARRAGAAGWAVVEARASALPPGGAWGVLAQTVHRALGLPRDGGGDTRRVALEALAASVADVAGLQAVLQMAPADPSWEHATAAERLERIGAAFAAFLAARSANRPLLVIVDDAHLVDEATAEVLANLPRRLDAARVAVVATCRPDSLRLVGSPEGWRSMRLRPLAQRAARRLLEQLLGRSPALEGLKQRLIRHTGGRPLFLEEVVRELIDAAVLRPSGDGWTVDRPIESLPLPASIRSTLQSRVDRLAAEDREVLRAAAVIGEQFEPRVVAAVLERPHARVMARLARLVTLELVARRGGDARRPERTRYGFRHSLIREAVYTSILRTRQVELHRRVVAALDADPSALPASEREAILAHHCLAAGYWQRAAAGYREVAERALMQSAPAAAEAACAAGLDALGRLGDVPTSEPLRVRLLLVAGDAAFARGDRAGFGERVAAALACAERRDDPATLLGALSSSCLHAWMEGRLRDAVALAERCHALAAEGNDATLAIGTAVRFGAMLQARGHYARSLELFEAALQRIPPARADERFGLATQPIVSCHASIARSLAELGRFDEARAIGAHAIAAAEASQHRFSFCYASREVGLTLIRAGDLPAAVTLLGKGLAMANQGGATVLMPALQSALGHALVRTSQPARGAALLIEARAAAVAQDTPVRMAQILSWLAEAQSALGRTAEARALALAALESARRCDEIGHEGWALLTLARLGVRLRDGADPLLVAKATASREGLVTLGLACDQLHAEAGPQGRSSHLAIDAGGVRNATA